MEGVVSGAAALIAFSAFFPAALSSFAPLLSPVVGLKPRAKPVRTGTLGSGSNLAVFAGRQGGQPQNFQAVPRVNHRIYVKSVCSEMAERRLSMISETNNR